MKRIWQLIRMAALVVIGVPITVGLMVYCNDVASQRDARAKYAAQREQAQHRASAASPASSWREVASWTGTSAKNTDDFTIRGDKFRVNWASRPNTQFPQGAIFQVYVYKSDGALVGLAANQQGAGKDSSVFRGAGDYYLQMNAANTAWAVEVEEWR